jgi:hypothetical protein
VDPVRAGQAIGFGGLPYRTAVSPAKSTVRGTRLLICVTLLAGLWVSTPVSAQAVSEYEVKAAFLLNFTKFVEWPPSAFPEPDSPISLCVLGDDPFGTTLDELVRGETVNGRALVIRRMSQTPIPKVCHVVFFGLPSKEVPPLLRSVGPGVLAVGEGESFIRAGGMIAFVIDNRRVRFIVNQTAATNAGLRLSSRLLAVAKTVEK